MSLQKQYGWREFKKFILFLIFFNAVIITAALTLLWFYLADYEAQSPKHLANQILQAYRTENVAVLKKYSGNLPRRLNTPGAFSEYLKFNINAHQVFYYQGVSKNPNRINVIFACGEKKIAVLSLKRTGAKSLFGFNILKIDSFSEIYHAMPKFTIYAPSNVKVLLNAKPIAQENPNERKHAVGQFAQIGRASPYETEYQVANLYSVPKITAVAQTQQPCNISVNDKNFTATIRVRPSKAMEDAIAKTARDATKKYAMYTTKDATFDEVSAYLYPNTQFYKSVKTYNSSWTQAHSGVSFRNLKVGNYTQFDSNDFSCDISFDYVVRISDATHEYASSYTCYLAKNSGTLKVVSLEVR